jgi:DNA adenine methylase
VTVSSIAPYFGAKRTLASTVVQHLGPHRAYCELFMGSAAVLLSKPEASMEIANDLYGSIINLARVLASDRWRELQRRCGRMLMHERLFLEVKAKVRSTEHVVAPSIDGVDDEHVDAAVWFFARSWLGRNGAVGTHESNATVARRFTSNGGGGGIRWRAALASLRGWHDRLQRVQFSQMDAIEMASRIEDSDDWAIYADPPYIDKGAKYVHDFEPGDHARLAEALGRFRQSKVVVSYYDHPDMDAMYPADGGWCKVHCPVHKGLVNGSGRAATGYVPAPEILLLNHAACEAVAADGLFGDTVRAAEQGVTA